MRRGAPLPGLGRAKLPVVDGMLQIVGWVDGTPEFRDGLLRHPDAERILKGRFECTYIAIPPGPDAVRAGAPENWKQSWRCLALRAVK